MQDLGITFYPIALADRRGMRSLRVHDERGRALPTLTQRESTDEARAVLASAAE